MNSTFHLVVVDVQICILHVHLCVPDVGFQWHAAIYAKWFSTCTHCTNKPRVRLDAYPRNGCPHSGYQLVVVVRKCAYHFQIKEYLLSRVLLLISMQEDVRGPSSIGSYPHECYV